MTISQRKLLLNLYSSPFDILKLAKQTEIHVKEALKSIQTFKGNVEELVEKLDDISDKMCSVTDSSECIKRLHPDRRWRKTADEAFNSTCLLMNELNSDRNLSQKFTEIVNLNPSKGSTELNAVIESFKRDFEVFKDFSDGERNQIKKLQESVDTAAVEFENLQSIGSLEKMIKLRFELAKAVGFKNPLEICLRDKQLNTHELVMAFIKDKWEGLDRYEKSQNRLVYTNLRRVTDALIRLSREFFDIRIELAADYDFGDSLSFKFKVYDDKTFLGSILFDLTARKWKDPHPTHYTIKCRKSGTPGLFLISIGIDDLDRISWNQSQSIFHEFGHALHSVLSETKYQVLSGTRGPVDLAEIPSNLFEFIHDSKEIQEELNVANGFEVISGERIRKEEAFQIQIAALDQLLHAIEPPKTGNNWSRDLARQIETIYGVKKGRDWHCSLPHLSTYGGTYFSYIYSKSIAEIIRAKYEMSLFKREFLVKGGTARLDFIK